MMNQYEKEHKNVIFMWIHKLSALLSKRETTKSNDTCRHSTKLVSKVTRVVTREKLASKQKYGYNLAAALRVEIATVDITKAASALQITEQKRRAAACVQRWKFTRGQICRLGTLSTRKRKTSQPNNR